MTVRFYLLPIQRNIENTSRWPKYFRWRLNPDGIACPWSMKDYGDIDVCVIAADILDADHAYVSAQADVYSFPLALDASIGQAALSVLTTYLEGAFVPADWMNASTTNRAALRTVTGMFLFMQRLTAITGNSPLAWGITLNTQYRNIPAQYQTAIQQTYSDLGYNASVIRSNWTVRVLLKNTADQWGAKAIDFGLATL